MTCERSVSCHLPGNKLHPHQQAGKSQSEVNLARLVVDKHAGNRSPVKQLQKLEHRDSFASMRSLNSFLSVCEGLDANYEVEDESLFDNEPVKDDRTALEFSPELHHQRSVVSGVSVNSLLSLIEDTKGHVDRPPVICIKEPEDSPDIKEKENQTLITNGELPAEKSEKRGGTGRITSDEKSQTGRVGLHNVVICSVVTERA